MRHSLIWFRNDLRLSDNSALNAALAETSRLSAIYIDCPGQNRLHLRSRGQADFIRRNLDCLETSLQSIGIALNRLSCERYAEVPDLLARFCHENGIDSVHANQEVPINERRRDQAVQDHAGVNLQLHNDDCVLPHGSVRKADGEMFRVFTPFSRAWLKRLQMVSYHVTPAPPSVRFGENPDHAWPAGETAAQSRLKQFCADQLNNYPEQRDFPARQATSALSPYLAIGVLSPRQCLAALENTLGYLPLSRGEKGFSWFNELIWREFYRHLMVEFPRLSMNQPFQAETKDLQWLDDDEHFERWCKGETGYPIVDAAMRCLNTSGWMHNRLRMIVASFLTKDLQTHWLRGADYFMSRLIDADLAANNGGWQWAASTGADAAPYFRIFNPLTQSRKFDPEGVFIRQWLPELGKVPQPQVHQPWDWLQQHDPGNPYPQPIIDHAVARVQTLARFQALKQRNTA